MFSFRMSLSAVESSDATVGKSVVKTTSAESHVGTDIRLLPRLTNDTPLSFLLVVSLLFGGLHQLPESTLFGHPVGEYSSHSEHGEFQHEHPVGALYRQRSPRSCYTRATDGCAAKPGRGWHSRRLGGLPKDHRSGWYSIFPWGSRPLLGVFRL